MIVVTGATGKLGQLVIEKLAERVSADRIAVSVRNASKAAALSDRGIRARESGFDDESLLGRRPQTMHHALMHHFATHTK